MEEVKTEFKKRNNLPWMTHTEYNFVKTVCGIGLLILLILPWFKKFDWSVGVLCFFFLDAGDYFAALLQTKLHIGRIAALLWGYLLDLVVCMILFVYLFWAAGRIEFVK
ncbi:hypothetical protein PT285_00870 [Lactobacillus sp. ESL0791]|uniref:hypothetical protein n=1 Tax=Lactobacillus sp. ESL0791 TaxID=2983234 RepID=UPI0023F90656|nr:hypothetical protein [Lactobacillus sp. ESL0791]MDF7637990.1 hypothetical protein [Lactobacillus sp. ESL0791]